MAIRASIQKLGVADPCPAYSSMKKIWEKNRAVCGGERFVKEYDGLLDTLYFSNLLIPFSPSMSAQQYEFYKAEAELPGLVSLYAKFIVGGLLRKQPHLELPDYLPKEARSWILDEFGQDSSPLSVFLAEALNEELITGSSWVYIDYPSITEEQAYTLEEPLSPYPILYKAENIINWRVAVDPLTGQQLLSSAIIRAYEEIYPDDEFHPRYVDTVWVHEIVNGYYQVRKFIANKDETPFFVNGSVYNEYSPSGEKFNLIDTQSDFYVQGERLRFIPLWPLTGQIGVEEPFITPLVDKEVSLYNKMSRRNHLLYGASTFTPVVASDMSDEEFDELVSSGLGSWLRVRQGEAISVLETPTDALKDMEKAILSSIEEMAKMGIRMLSPESAQSGIALTIRNAAQTATLGLLNTQISNTLTNILAFMLEWKYGKPVPSSDVVFNLSADFQPTQIGADWMRLVTEWYESQLIPRTTWLQILKQNDILPSDYDDEDAANEINSDEFTTPKVVPDSQINIG